MFSLVIYVLAGNMLDGWFLPAVLFRGIKLLYKIDIFLYIRIKANIFNYFLYRNTLSKVYPAMYIENVTELAFDDITPEDPDFSSIQGKYRNVNDIVLILRSISTYIFFNKCFALRNL